MLCYVMLCCSVLCCFIVLYFIQCFKKKANQRPGLPLHILRYVTGNIQRVVFHSAFPSLLVRATIYWGPFEDFSKTSSETFQLLRTITNISDHVRKFSDDFRTLPKTSEDFQKILKPFWTVS